MEIDNLIIIVLKTIMSKLNEVKFDEDEFDKKVCNTLSNIHYRQLEKVMEKKFYRWVNDNLEHLDQMFLLVQENDVDFDTFCYFVFINSDV